MKNYGLIGYPLIHSFSKKYFTEKFEQENMVAQYENFSIPNLNNLNQIIEENNLQGFNVTIPFKEKIIEFLDDIEPITKQVGSVNCVKIINKKKIGYNTDIIGFEKSFLPFIEHCQNKKALIFGTGGSSKAIRFILQKHQIPYLLVSRNEIQNGITYSDINEAIILEYTILINTTPVGTFPHMEDKLPIPFQLITAKHFVYDLVYNPAKTTFLYFAEEQGSSIKNGLEMLHIQAEESWKIWNR